jgi:spore coat polysaccharide biosynthesis predicted glycosyltransferase SpsG
MTSSADLRIVFRAAAGPRRGFGHLVRCVSLARALGVRPLMSVRGGTRVRDTALAFGADVLADDTPQVLRFVRPDVVVIDDPIASNASRWMQMARRLGALVVTIHDLGIGAHGADLAIDGSVTRNAPRHAGRRTLRGAKFAVLDPRVERLGRRAAGDRMSASGNGRLPSRAVLIALGGGPHAELADEIAQAIVAADAYAEVRIAGGFVAGPRRVHPRIKWIKTRGLAPELAKTQVAVVGGGVSLYEAAAMGVAAVGVPVVKAQEPTVLAFARRGAALGVRFGASSQTAATKALLLLNNLERRIELSERSRTLVDGGGARRAAAAVIDLARERQR